MSSRCRSSKAGQPAVVLLGGRRDLHHRRPITVLLPEFVICALEAKVRAANAEVDTSLRASLDDYLESELVNLITVRDVAILEESFPGFSKAVSEWLRETSA